MALGGFDDSNKVFYKTSGLGLKNSLSSSTRNKSLGSRQVGGVGTGLANRSGRRATYNPNAITHQNREIRQKLNPGQIRETVLMKKPTQTDLKESLIKH